MTRSIFTRASWLAKPAVLLPSLAVTLLLGLYLIALLVTAGEVPRNTSVEGVSIGGQSRAAAERLLADRLADRGGQLRVVAAGQSITVRPADAGLTVDVAATVDEAAHRSLDPLSVARQLFASRSVEPVLTVDDAKLAATVTRIAAAVDRPVREGTVRFEAASPVAVPGQEGRSLDRTGAGQALRQAVGSGAAEVTVPVKVTRPTVSAAEVSRAMTEFAGPALAADVVLDLGGRPVTVTPAQLAPMLSMRAAPGGHLTPDVDAKALGELVRGRLGGLDRPAKDASFQIKDGRPVVVPARAGVRLDPAVMARDLLTVLPRPAPRVVKTGLVTAQPSFTTERAQALGIREKVSSFTTYYPYAAYRLQNIHRAADLINNTVLEPGETFSLNQVVGERTAQNGFAVGTIIQNGRFAEAYGGGVSQVATTTFNAMFFAGLKDVEHHPHSFYISRYPAGREATVAWGAKDLRFTNDSGSGILITTSYTSSSVTVTMWGTKMYDVRSISSRRYAVRGFEVVYDPKPGCVPQGGVPGYQIDVTRVLSKGGKEVSRQTFHTKYNPAAHIYCRPAPAPSPTPSPTPPAGGPVPSTRSTPTTPPPAG